jgi:uridylate kinase
MRKIVGDTWSPGTNAPFDPIASKLAEKLGLKVFFAEGTDLEEVKKVLQGKKFRGTIIG